MPAPDRGGLSREVIAATALSLTDEGGLGGLSMRKLGAALGVEAMSIYHYVENKEDLLDAVLERLYAEIEFPAVVTNNAWDEAVREATLAFYQVLVDHPAAIHLFVSRPAPSEAAAEGLQWGYRLFRNLGLNEVDAFHANHSAISVVLGHAAREVEGRFAHEPEPPEGSWRAHPDDQELLEYTKVACTVEPRDTLLASVDVVLAGLRARFDLP